MDDPGQIAQHLPLKPLDFSVLLVLAEEEHYGYGIVKRIRRKDRGGIQLAPSNLYHVLDRMMAAGLVAEAGSPEASEGSGIRRRYYQITPLGRRVAAAEAGRMEGLVRVAGRLRLLTEVEA